MAQTKALIEVLKNELKRQGKTYRHVADALGLSEASVKRLFSERVFSLDRLDRICDLLGLEISDLVRIMEQRAQRTTHLSLAQENELVADVKLLLMAHFLMLRWSFSEIIENYKISEHEGIQLLAKLDRMKFIQLLPGNRVKLIIAKKFDWITHGPIQRFYEEKVQTEFINSSFSRAGEFRVFLSGMLTQTSNTELIRKLKRLANEFDALTTEDESVPMNQRLGMSVLLAIRPWSVAVFDELRRNTEKGNDKFTV